MDVSIRHDAILAFLLMGVSVTFGIIIDSVIFRIRSKKKQIKINPEEKAQIITAYLSLVFVIMTAYAFVLLILHTFFESV